MVQPSLRLTVAVPTYQRPEQLARLLPRLLVEIETLEALGVAGGLLVIDNDPGQSAKNLDYSDPRIRYVAEPKPGLAAVRNRALAEADTELLQFIDDDEHPVPGWLATMVRTQLATGAAAVAGRVLPEFAGEIDPWLAAGEFFVRRNLPTGTVVPTAPCGNLLLDLAQIRDLKLSFDERFALLGGEDTMFTTQLTKSGGRIVFCSEAAVVDQVPLDRATRRWVLARARSHGNTAGLVQVLTNGPLTRPKLLAGGIGRIIFGIGKSALGLVTRDLATQAKGAKLAARGLGFVQAAVGYSVAEYARQPRPTLAFQAKTTLRRAAGWVSGSVTEVTDASLLVLTYDDGPDPETTPGILAALAKNRATATFFVLANRAAAHPELLDQIRDKGHEVALHGLDHTRWTTLPPAEVLARVQQARQLLAKPQIRHVRPPYGSLSVAIWRRLRAAKLEVVLWSATAADWRELTPAERSVKLAQEIGGGKILLAHDGFADASDNAESAPKPKLDKAALADEICKIAADQGLTVVSLAAARRRGAKYRRQAIFTK